MKRDQRFAPHGTLALLPKAFGLTFSLDEPCGHEITENNVAVVDIRGPIMHHHSFFFDSYEEIKLRVAAALAEQPHMVVLSIDSPGGLVSGAFDTARELRVMAKAVNIDLYAHIDGQGTSAAYAIASAAAWIGATESSEVGSIGVIDTMVDLTVMNERDGIAIELVTSGARKSDGNPNVPITDEARAATQVKVNNLAEMFFQLVADHRELDKDDLRAMQAATVHGPEAVTLGLIDEIATLEQTIAFATPGPRPGETEATAEGKYNVAKAFDDAIAELRKVAAGDDEKEAEQARKMLAVLGAEDEDEDDPPESQDEDEDDPPPEAPEEEDESAAAAAAAAEDDEEEVAAMAARALAGLHKLELKDKKRTEAAERAKLLASRPDFSKAMIKSLKKAPMSVVREMVKNLERGEPRPVNPRAAAAQPGVQGVVGHGQNQDPTGSRLSPEEKKALDEKMGITTATAGVINLPHKIVLGGMVEKNQEA